jgi:hypothetical protein
MNKSKREAGICARENYAVADAFQGSGVLGKVFGTIAGYAAYCILHFVAAGNSTHEAETTSKKQTS